MAYLDFFVSPRISFAGVQLPFDDIGAQKAGSSRSDGKGKSCDSSVAYRSISKKGSIRQGLKPFKAFVRK